MVQWLKLCASNARGARSIPGQGTKIPHAARGTAKITKKNPNNNNNKNQRTQTPTSPHRSVHILKTLEEQAHLCTHEGSTFQQPFVSSQASPGLQWLRSGGGGTLPTGTGPQFGQSPLASQGICSVRRRERE